MIELIVACARDSSGNMIIGNENRLPWHVPGDLRRFKEKTMGHPIVMGRKTYESLPRKPLPGRENIILTANKNYVAGQCTIVHDAEAIIGRHGKTWESCYIIGGAQIYGLFLPHAQRIHLSLIDIETDGDTYFPMSWEEMCEKFSWFFVEQHEGPIRWREYIFERSQPSRTAAAVATEVRP